MTIHHFAILASLLLLIYHQLTTWFPLYPWNDVKSYSRKEILLEAGSNGLLMGLGLFCLAWSNHGFFYWYPLVYYPFLLSGEVFQWWLPYFSEKFAKGNVNFDYESKFSNTITLIPHRPGKRTPDANHIVLHAITIITVVIVYWERLY